MSNISKNQGSTFSLILGIFFIFFGIYRVYKYFINEVSTFRAILGFGFIVYGIFILSRYKKSKQP